MSNDETYCVIVGCRQPATHERPHGITRDGDEIVDLVCPDHAEHSPYLTES
jgi:hypothetical protein